METKVFLTQLILLIGSVIADETSGHQGSLSMDNKVLDRLSMEAKVDRRDSPDKKKMEQLSTHLSKGFFKFDSSKDHGGFLLPHSFMQRADGRWPMADGKRKEGPLKDLPPFLMRSRSMKDLPAFLMSNRDANHRNDARKSTGDLPAFLMSSRDETRNSMKNLPAFLMSSRDETSGKDMPPFLMSKRGKN